MGKIIACIDGSAYADSVCALSAWAAERSGLSISLLHVIKPHSEAVTKSDLSGQIGFGANTSLLEKLSKLDEEHGKLEQEKGKLMLEHAKAELAAKGISKPDMLHRRGSLVETLTEMENEMDLVVMGKRGEHADIAPAHLSSNLERVARAIHKPLLIAIKDVKPINRFLIAYDGSVSAQNAVEYISSNPLLTGLECYLLKVGDKTSEDETALQLAQNKLTSAGFTVNTMLVSNKSVTDAVASAITENAIDLLVIGAYGHSKIRSLILGSTTPMLIKNSNIPLLLFR